MRWAKRAPDGPRHGDYAQNNYVPHQQGGTFRVVHQGHPLPDPGAQNYTYSTFMFPVQDMYGNGYTLTRGVPPAVFPAAAIADLGPVYLENPWPRMTDMHGSTMPLLPSALVDQFAGKTP